MGEIYDNIRYALNCFCINSYMTKRDVYDMAHIIRTELAIPEKQPIDPFGIIEAYPETLELQFHSFDSNKIGGFLVKNDPEVYKSLIILNDVKPWESQKFNCCHELIHFIKHPEGNYACSSSLSNKDPFEWQANEGAAEMLIPFMDVIPFIAKEYESARAIRDKRPMWGNLPFAFIPFRLAIEYDVSERIAEYRIANLEYEIYQYINGIDINSLAVISKRKQEEKSISFPTLLDSYREGKTALNSSKKEVVSAYAEEYVIHSGIPSALQALEKVTCELYGRLNPNRALDWNEEINETHYITENEKELLDRLKFGE